MIRKIFTGGRIISPAQTQWAPGLSAHDPNPPITLESQPQRLPFWQKPAIAILALGLLDVPDVQAVNQNTLHAFRGTSVAAGPQPQRLPAWPKTAFPEQTIEPEFRVNQAQLYSFRNYAVPASGHFLVPTTQVILYDVEREPVRIDHASRLFFGRSSAVANQPFWIFPRTKAPEETLEAERRGNHALLHLYRVGYQTVGQPNLYRFKPAGLEPPVEPDATRIDHTRLHLYRVGFQTVGQPWLTWPKPGRETAPTEPDAVRTDHSARLFYGRATVTVVGQTWLMWPPATRQDLAVDPCEVRTNHALQLFYGRTTAAIAGQPWYLWPTAKIEATVEPDPRWSDHTLLHRYRVGFQTVGQPWYLWKVAQIEATTEPEARRGDHGLLHRYRVGYQTVGQSWLLWSQGTRPEAIPEADAVRTHHELQLFYGRSVSAVLPGQPWYLWKPARAEQTVEADAVRFDYSALIFNRPGAAIVPPLTGGEWIVRARRRKGR